MAANGRPGHPNAAAALGAPPLGRGGVSRDKGFSPSTPGSPPRVFQRGGVARVGWSRTGPAHWQPASSGQGAATAGKERDIFMQRGERSPAHDALWFSASQLFRQLLEEIVRQLLRGRLDQPRSDCGDQAPYLHVGIR